MNLKLPLYAHDVNLCDPLFRGDHSYIILRVSKNSEILAECTGCGIQWSGKYKKHWLPDEVALALMAQ